MNTNYSNAIADSGGDLISHIGLIDETGTEISGGSYARQAITWTTASGGTIRPNADLVFDIPAGVTVAGWSGYSALTGGTDYGGEDLTNEAFTNAGQYKLIASGTGILHNNV
jgi:hypothetical protein